MNDICKNRGAFPNRAILVLHVHHLGKEFQLVSGGQRRFALLPLQLQLAPLLQRGMQLEPNVSPTESAAESSSRTHTRTALGQRR